MRLYIIPFRAYKEIHLYLSLHRYFCTGEDFSFYIACYFSVIWAYMKSDILQCLRAPFGSTKYTWSSQNLRVTSLYKLIPDSIAIRMRGCVWWIWNKGFIALLKSHGEEVYIEMQNIIVDMISRYIQYEVRLYS